MGIFWLGPLKGPISLTQGPWVEPKIFQKSTDDTSLETALKYEQNRVFIRCFSVNAAEMNVSTIHKKKRKQIPRPTTAY